MQMMSLRNRFDNMTVTKTEIRKNLSHLPEPDAKYQCSDTAFEVYRAKNLKSKKWNSTALKNIVQLSRASYLRYGGRELFDRFDDKACIYLVRAMYKFRANGEHTEEWLSIRMVPGDGLPKGFAEPEIYRLNGSSVDHVMQEKIGKKDFWKKIASSSRMCGIKPYIIDSNGKITFVDAEQLRYTPLSFAIIHKQFIKDYPLSKYPYRYITAIIRPDFLEKGLKYSSKNRDYWPTFTAAHDFLNVKKDKIRVDRNVYSFHYPDYWFDHRRLLAVVNKLRALKKKAPIKSIQPNLFSDIPKRNQNGDITVSGVSMRVKELNNILNLYDLDMPELKITRAPEWYKGMDTILKAANISELKKTSTIEEDYSFARSKVLAA